MAKRPIKRIDFHNPTTGPIQFLQGTSPNDYPEEVTVLPGETYKGYANYHKFYARNGLALGPSPTAGKMREVAAQASADAAEMLAEANTAKLEALEAKREAEAAKAEAEVAIAEANAARATAALTEQRDDDEPAPAPAAPPVDDFEAQAPKPFDPSEDDDEAAAEDELPADPKIEKAKAARAKKKGKSKGK